MISAIRNKFGSKLLDIFIWLAIIAFVLLYIVPGGKKATRAEQWAVSVDGESATYREYLQILESKRKGGQLKVNNDLSGKQKEEKYRKEVVEYLTDDLLMKLAASNLNIVLDPKMVGARILKMLPGATDESGKVSIDSLKKMIGEEYLVLLEKQIINDLKRETISNAFMGGMYIPKFSMENQYRSEYAYKKFSILTFSYQKAYDAVVKEKVSDKELKAYFAKQNKETKRYWTTETRSGEVWTFTPEKFGIKVSEKQIKNYYNRYRKEQFVKTKPQVQVRRILFEVDKDKDKDGKQLSEANKKAGKLRGELAADPKKFEEFAKKHSDDKLTASKGGLLDFFAEGERERLFSNAAFDLRSDGEISEVIETGRGVEILQRVSKKGIKFKPLEDVKDEIKKKVEEKQFQKLFSINARRAIMNKLQTGTKKIQGSMPATFTVDSKKTSEAFDKFVKSKGATKTDIKNIVLKSGNKEVEKLFGLRKAGSKGQFTDGNKGIIVVLKNIDLAKVKDFEKIKSEVMTDFQKDAAIKKLEEQMKKAAASMKSGKSLKDIASAIGAEYEQTPLISQDAISKTAGLRKKGVPMQTMWQLKSKDAYKIKIADDADKPNGYLIKLDLIQKAAREDFENKKGQIYRSMFHQYRPKAEESFIDSLRKDATIKVNTAIIDVR